MVAGGDTPDLLPPGPCSGHPSTGDTIAVSGQWYAQHRGTGLGWTGDTLWSVKYEDELGSSRGVSGRGGVGQGRGIAGVLTNDCSRTSIELQTLDSGHGRVSLL